MTAIETKDWNKLNLEWDLQITALKNKEAYWVNITVSKKILLLIRL